MRFMMIYTADAKQTKRNESGATPSQDEIVAMGKYIEREAKIGRLIDTGGLQPSAGGARVRVDGGKITVTDGPFTESKELVAGYAVIEVKSKAEAIECGREFLQLVGGGQTEIRPLFSDGDFEPK
jgi:hypothetical protein